MTAVRLSDRKALGSSATGGSSPCHLSVHPGGRFLLSADYGSGTVAVHRIEQSGVLGGRTALVTHSAGTGSGSTGPARASVRHRPGRRARPRRGPGHGHRVHVPPRRQGRDAHRGVAGGRAGWRGTAPADLPPRRAVRLPRQRAGRHGDGVRLRADVGPADDRGAAADGLGARGGHQLPGAARRHRRRPVGVSRQPGPQQRRPVRRRGGRGPAAAARHRAGGRRLPRHIALSPDGGLLFTANQRSGDVSVFHVDADSGELRPAGEPFASPVAVCALPL